MKKQTTIKFTSALVSETAYNVTPLGMANSEMTLNEFEDGNVAITWEANFIDDKGEETGEGESVGMEIELQDENNPKLVTGYDGCFTLPEQALELLRSCGYDVSEMEDL